MTTIPPPSLRELFDQALALSPEQRDRYLDEHCRSPFDRAELDRLLAADAIADAGTPLSARSARQLAEAIGDTAPAPTWFPGQRIGAFELQEILGEGGSSTVFRAVRDLDGVRQEVALKLLHRGLHSPESQRLFRRERQALASLSHPNIAHLIDGGVTDSGHPYLVMEYVDGQPITDHSRDQQLDLRARLRLLVVVCHAVAAAQRNLIVHRDLKPSNILVSSDGAVKLLDFGIAKLLVEDLDGAADATRSGFAPLTPGYAAPEQLAGGMISTATDVYALGVVMHELLIGERPDRSPVIRPSVRVADMVTDLWALPAPRPVLRAALRGDLDTIVLKAQAEEPERRYAAAADLADDIQRHLDAQPVRAHPPSTWYRTRKFVQRHRGGVVLTTVFAVGLLASLALALWQANEARQQASRANHVRDFVIDLFDSARASLPRDQRPTPEQLVTQAQARLSEAAALDVATQVDLRRTLAEVWLSLSAFPEADTLLAHAQAQAASLDQPMLNAELVVLRADGWQRSGRYADAAAGIEQVINGLRDADSPLLLRALGVLASARLAQGQPAAAQSLQREALAMAQDRYGAGSQITLAAAMELGNTLAASQHYPMARDILQPALASWRDSHAPEDDRYVRALSSLAVTSDALGELADSEAQFRELLELKQRIYPSPHDAIAKSLRNLGQLLGRGSDPVGAQQALEQALAMQQQVLGGDHREVAATYDALGALYAGQRRLDEAASQYRLALAICARTALRDEVCPRARNNLGQTYYRQGRLDEAETEMTQALTGRRDLFGEDHPTVAYSLSTLANVATSRHDYGRAVDLSQQALELLERLGHGRSREAALVRNGLAQALHRSGDLDRALIEINRTLRDWRAQKTVPRVREVMMLVEKAQIHAARDEVGGVRSSLDEIEHLAVPEHELPSRTRELLLGLIETASAS